MIINHNIAALNTYRQLSANGVNTQKSLEKLSSGLRINRAGDDAAGLAISEKMRAQIRGLDQAARNAQDGISMIQTAEGGLNETHAILQRMRELANQAANDTNVGVDRNEIQKEMNQLSSEINRIGNTTEFNTQKLLNGGGEVKEITMNTMQAGAASGAFKGGADIPITAGKTSVAAVAAEWESGDLTALTDGDSGTISFAGVTINITAADGGSAGIDGINQVGANLAIDTTVTSAAADQAQLIVNAFNAVKAAQPDTGSLANFTFGVNGDKITITGIAEDGAKNNSLALAVSGNVAGATAANATTAGVTEVRGEYSFEISTAFEKVGAGLTIGGQTFTAVATGAKAANGEFNVGTDAKQQAISLAAALNANSALNARFDAIVDGSKITLREKEMAATGVAVAAGTITVGTNDAVQGKYSFNIDESVAVGGRYAVGGVNIEVTDDANHAGLANGTAVIFSADTTQQASNLANAIAANSALSENFTVEASSNRITLTQIVGKETMTAATAQTSTNKNEGFQASFQVGANSGQSMTIEVSDMRSLALGISGKEAGTKATAQNGVEASYVKTAVVTNGTDNVNVEYALDVSSHDKATAAISVINDAIETVSAERSKMGAYQNRLEHTINNLGTSSENLTAAESRIRDVDMAKEMMEFTKQNILSQAAQAMLAQANQQPQGVLQLLR